MTRIIADLDRCVGTGQCVMTAPEVFDQSDDDGTVMVLEGHLADPAKLLAAASLCPGQALSGIED
ncbi:ferredoxin [Streptomyces sp. NBC_01261]|uniref:ferredoxin n=1 Tax=unclassified Streptomyces TaxID=2593676 RepID=UPI002E2F7030|nr:ferredoxin [Streptomyces sp. NBC_01261]